MKNDVTTYNTKKMLADALKVAMRQKPFSKITVKEIVEHCGVNRKTFYYHFADIYDLLRWMFEEEAINVVKRFNILEDYSAAIRFALDYIEENDHFISCAYDAVGRDQMKQFFYADFVGTIQAAIAAAEREYKKVPDPQFEEYVAKFYAEAIAGMLIDWIKNKQDKEITISYLTRIIETALNSIKKA